MTGLNPLIIFALKSKNPKTPQKRTIKNEVFFLFPHGDYDTNENGIYKRKGS